MKRPQNAEPFMTSLRASTGLATVYVVHDDDDWETAWAWKELGATILSTGRSGGTFAEKVNQAAQASAADGQPWLFICGDDVAFHAGWLDHAQAMAGDDFHVVGTNDLGASHSQADQHTFQKRCRQYLRGDS
jgi:hypothetical protein